MDGYIENTYDGQKFPQLQIDPLAALVDVAERRHLKKRLNGNRGDAPASLGDSRRKRLTAIGKERALVYRVLAFTGIRYGELRSVPVAQVKLDAHPPHIELKAKDEKGRRGALLPLRTDLAEHLREYLAENLVAAQGAARAAEKPIPMALDPKAPLFSLPEKMTRVFIRDLKAAKIEERDSRGRVVDVHSLRHTYATMLAQAGVPLQQVQQLMRHSDPKLTANVYTHLDVLDGAAAIAKLPALSHGEEQGMKQGTYNESTTSPTTVVTTVKSGKRGSSESIVVDPVKGMDRKLNRGGFAKQPVFTSDFNASPRCTKKDNGRGDWI